MALFARKASRINNTNNIDAPGQDQPETLSDAAATSDQVLAQRIKKRFRAGVAYKRAQQFYEKWAEYQRYWEADQWPEVTPDTETMPRPVTNQFASIIEQKVSALTYEMPEIYFEAVEEDEKPPGTQGTPGIPGTPGTPGNQNAIGGPAGFDFLTGLPISPVAGVNNPSTGQADLSAAELLSQVAANQAARLNLEQLLENGCRDAALLGTAIWYFPWDNTITGGTPGVSAWIGDIAGYIIDPADFFPGDPTSRDIQSQPWIILAERRPIDEVKEFYREYAPEIVDVLKPDRLTSDTQVYDHQQIEQEETGYVNILHCWWKERKGYQSTLHYAVECQGYLLRHEKELYKHGLYPFVAFSWYPRRKSFWGKPESADIINNQKEINHLDGIMLLSAYFTGMPHIRVKDNMVDEQDITNDPGTVIRDSSPPGQWGVDYMQPPSMPAYPVTMRDKLVESMKDVSGAHEAWSGKAPSSDLNASAIIALQEAAGVRIRGIQRRFHQAIREMGRLWLAYWKEFYTEARLIRIVGPDNQAGVAWFRGTDYADMQFDVQVRAGSASPYSRALLMANLDKMLEKQVITPEEYLEMLPPDVFPKAKQLLQRRQEQRQQMQALQALLQGGMTGGAGGMAGGQGQGAGMPAGELAGMPAGAFLGTSATAGQPPGQPPPVSPEILGNPLTSITGGGGLAT